MGKQVRFVDLLREHRDELVRGWNNELRANRNYREDLLSDHELRSHCEQFLDLLQEGMQASDGKDNMAAEAWRPLREFLGSVLHSWVEAGLKPADVAAFVLLLKPPLFRFLSDGSTTAQQVAEDSLAASILLDQVAMWTTELSQQRLQSMIHRQQDELLELSTPVVTMWNGILALPVIGTLDSARTQVVMESLLERIVETGADVAILDITGVPTVDTMVAQHLLKAVTAARLMGASCIISGIRPSIAQTMVQLGVDLRDVLTKATLADAFAVALQRRGLRIVDGNARSGGE